LVSLLDFGNASLPYLERVFKKVTEGVMLTAPIRLERMYIEQIESQHELQQVAEVGKHLPLWSVAPLSINVLPF
jgi:DNA-binding IclR family transcriptional regulator